MSAVRTRWDLTTAEKCGNGKKKINYRANEAFIQVAAVNRRRGQGKMITFRLIFSKENTFNILKAELH